MGLLSGKGEGTRPGNMDGQSLKGKNVPGAEGHKASKSVKAFSRDYDTARVGCKDDRPGAVRPKGYSKR